MPVFYGKAVRSPNAPSRMLTVKNLQAAFRGERTVRWGKLLGVFFAGQTLVQAIGLVTGFLLIRWLSVESYAQFSIAFGVQSTVGALADLGFCGSVVALAGDRGKQPEVLGGYLAAALYYRRRILLVLFPLTIIALPLLMAKQGWNLGVQVALVASVLCSIFAQGYLSLYSAPLLIHQRLKESYATQVVAAGGRLSLNTTLHVISALGPVTASWTTTLATAVNALLMRRASSKLVKVRLPSNESARREMLAYVAPILPGIVFTALQSQITLFVIATFGRTKNIAEIAALGRLGQVLIILATLNAVILAPYFAKVSPAMLGRRYAQVMSVALLVAVAIIGAAFTWPGAILLVLGAKYAQLQQQVSWSIVAWAANYLGGLMWCIHSARKWNFWWVSWSYIVTVLLVQIVTVTLFDLRSTMNVIYLSVVTAALVVLVHMVNGIYGFSRERQIPKAAERGESPRMA